MFKFESIQDFICKSLIGKVLVKVGDVVLNEKIEKAWHDSATNSIVVYSDKSQTFIYNDSFVLVNKLIEIDWESYSKREEPKFGYSSPYSVGLDENEDYADVYTTEEFYEHVESGMFIDSDGTGYPSNGTHHLYAGLSVRDLAACKYSETVTHVIWYNK